MRPILTAVLLGAAVDALRLPRTLLARFSSAPPVGANPTRLPPSFVEDDGFALAKHKRERSPWYRFLGPAQPGTLVLVRHGESTWNRNSTFSGWADVDLSARGEREVEHAARLLLEAGITVDVAYTSRLKRAIRSCWILLRGLDQIYRPVFKSWRLNERHYGALTGLSKPDLALELGEARVQRWRHGLHERPPPMPADGSHAYAASRERKYDDLPREALPRTESLADTMARTIVLWDDKIAPDLLAGRNVMVVAHGNSLRGLVKHVDGVADGAIAKVSIPNGIPLVYGFEPTSNNTLVPVRGGAADSPINGEFLEKPGLLRAALAAEARLAAAIPGAVRAESGETSSTFRLRALAKLKLERRLIELAGDANALDRVVSRAPSETPPVDALYALRAPDAAPTAEAAATRSLY